MNHLTKLNGHKNDDFANSFSAHRIQLADGSWTMPKGVGEETAFADLRMKTLIDRVCGSLSGKRILDVGCLEGGYSVYLAQQQAKEVIGIEGREINYQRCLLVAESLKLPNLTFYHRDVKEARKDWLGKFDIVFAGGILYHLDDPFTFLRNLCDMTDEFILFDTHVALRDHWAVGDEHY